MSGKIIYEPPAKARCELAAGCPDKPKAENYHDGTIWQCDLCNRKWVKFSGAQYNEPFDSWRRGDS